MDIIIIIVPNIYWTFFIYDIQLKVTCPSVLPTTNYYLPYRLSLTYIKVLPKIVIVIDFGNTRYIKQSVIYVLYLTNGLIGYFSTKIVSKILEIVKATYLVVSMYLNY